MARVWSEEAKLERWLDVELAALDGWARVGVVPRASARADPGAARARAPTRGRDRADDEPRRRRLRRRRRRRTLGAEVAGSTTASRRPTCSTPPSRSTVQDAGALVLTGLDARVRGGRRARRGAPRHPHASAGRTASTPSRRPSGSSSPAGPSQLDRDREPARRRRSTGMRVGKLSGAVGTYATDDPEVERHRVRGARSRGRARARRRSSSATATPSS